ncbi:c-type cytochrome [Thiohalobacter sp. IOR34]|uniref:c-type cytochrome n=1 Tax=Thiohalobacter sp. IOR34 TaxID=3057176 RepID=UPI0025AF42A0|nr:c-type cytochrome [Thiohalobacter sp. IOR34]WJW75419.1 c-type cytochrome [Thiohalobacter sp. IOR34]
MMQRVASLSLGRGAAALLLLVMSTAGQAADEMMQQAIEDNIRPVGTVKVAGESSAAESTAAAAPAPAAAAEAAPAAAGGAAADGKQIVTQSCFACHGTGAAGAPKIGDKAAWAPRIAQGMDTLLQNAITGLRAMPPKGTCMTCSEAELKAAIEYMVSQSQ